ncbi:antA/AntB antirepressor family protein [Comamonas koreensis]|uniref:AntA/AntB antirepressor family protein n=1 Tax=Comamonas koreensis TaxID=160825 RepID=A0AAW4XWR2_9BURK|nr:antA/AntB antirepressor family protein [Comamonas koreensis]MCD2165570.1 antA/AntB antirepressor family protein [Comamonas koreensis]
MNELIQVVSREIGGTVVLTANARELHAYLGPDTRFNDWIDRRIAEYDFQEGKDFYSFLSKTPSGGRPSKEYTLALNMAKELSMVERTPKGKEARLYFIECERVALAGQVATLPQPKKSASQSGLPEFRRARALDMAAKTAERIVAQFPSLSEQSRQVVFAKVINPVAGIEILALPHLEQETYPAEKVGEKLGISANMVGRIANSHGLKIEEYGMFVLDKSPNSSKQVRTFVYNDKGVEAVKFYLEVEKLPKAPERELLAKAATSSPTPKPQGVLL